MNNILTGALAATLSAASLTSLKNPFAANNLTKKYLLTAELKQSATIADLKNGYSQFSGFVQNGYKAYRLTYNSVLPDGKPVVASGAVYVPDINGPLPLINYNHGTIFPSRERSAPSYMGNYDLEAGIAKLFAANGYLVVMPDYIGYGAAKQSIHPYGAYHVTARAVIDMLYAAKEFCDEENIGRSGKNFFTGWSEGAAVTLATVLDLEKNHDACFKPAATVLNAGPYYSSVFVDHILDADKPLQYMSSYVWVLRTYNKLYGINRPDSYYFNEPYATRLSRDGEADISKDSRELFTKSFREDFHAGRDTSLTNALRENDLWNGKPLSPVIFCHGDHDEYVPLFNSQKAYDEMKAKDADVHLKIFKGQNHTGGVLAYLQTAMTTFNANK